jgi:hypothetical protein
VQGLAGPLPEHRLALVRKAFAKMDRSNAGVVDTRDIAAAFDASKATAVRAGRSSEGDALRAFVKPFLEAAEPGAHAAAVSQQAWDDHFALISAGIEDDAYFRLMMWNTWGLGTA